MRGRWDYFLEVCVLCLTPGTSYTAGRKNEINEKEPHSKTRRWPKSLSRPRCARAPSDPLLFPLVVCPGRDADPSSPRESQPENPGRPPHISAILPRGGLGLRSWYLATPKSWGFTTGSPASSLAWAFARVHRPGRRQLPVPLTPGAPGAGPGHSTRVYLKPLLASRLRTGRRPQPISRSCLGGVGRPLGPPRSRGQEAVEGRASPGGPGDRPVQPGLPLPTLTSTTVKITLRRQRAAGMGSLVNHWRGRQTVPDVFLRLKTGGLLPTNGPC